MSSSNTQPTEHRGRGSDHVKKNIVMWQTAGRFSTSPNTLLSDEPLEENHESYRQQSLELERASIHQGIYSTASQRSLQMTPEQLINQLGIGLPFGLLHRLSHKETQDLASTLTELLQSLSVQVCGKIPGDPVSRQLRVTEFTRHPLKIVAQWTIHAQDLGVLHWNAIIVGKPLLARSGQLRQISPDFLHVGLIQLYGNKIRFREIPVVVCFFLGTQSGYLTRLWIKMHGRLLNGLSGLQKFNLTHYLRLQSALSESEGVHVLQLSLHTESFPVPANRDVGVAPEGTLLHVDIRNPQVLYETPQLSEKNASPLRATKIRLRHNLHQWGPASIEVHQGVVSAIYPPRRTASVHQLACIFFHMDTCNAHTEWRTTVHLHLKVTGITRSP